MYVQDHPLRAAAADPALQEEVQHLVSGGPAQGPGRPRGQQGGPAQQAASQDAGADPGLRELHEQGPAGQRGRVQAEQSHEDRGHQVQL